MMQAVIASPTSPSTAMLSSSQPIPTAPPDHLLIHTAAVALNPTDWKHLSHSLVLGGSVLGCDFAGTVAAVGSSSTTSGDVEKWRVGDRVAGVVHGGNPANAAEGAFAEWVVVKEGLCLRVPDWMGWAEAASLTLGVATVGQGLYQKGLKLELPFVVKQTVKREEFVLIYGGSTATGVLGVQFAKLSGYTVLATASSKSTAYVKSLGADHVFDYAQSDVGAQIREYSSDKLKLVWDTVSTPTSAKVCAEALSSDREGCFYAAFLDNRCPREDVVSVGTMLYTIFGETFMSGGTEWPAYLGDLEWATEFMALASNLLAEGRLKPHRAVVRSGGLQAVIQGLEEMRKGLSTSGKMVYRVAAA